MTHKNKVIAIAAALAASPSFSFSQVSVTSGTYSQNFDGLTVTISSMPWTNNVTLPGWYAFKTTPTSSGPVTHIGTTSKIGTALALHGDTPDYALGSGNIFSGGDVNFGIRLVNNTGSTVSGFSVSYVGEQWFRADNTVQVTDSLNFSYHIFDSGTGSIIAENWVNVPALDFTSPNASAKSEATLNGNAPENQVTFSSWIAGVSLAEGQELWLRWTATDRASFNDHGLAIDNLVVTFGAIPEPAAYAALLGSLTLLAAGLRRRGRKTA